MHRGFCVAGFLAIVASLTVAGCTAANVAQGPSVANPASHRDVTALRVKPDRAVYKRALYVLETQSADIKILTNTRYRELGTITNGITLPVAESMDQFDNLYVANQSSGGGYVAEYARGATSPSFTYNANMHNPSAVAVDRTGNVYEGDIFGAVSQYFQKSNYVTQSCTLSSGLEPKGIAVGESGVFVLYYDLSNGNGSIYEYVGGLSGCNATLLFAPRGDILSGLALDADDNLITTVNTTTSPPKVAVVAPPYASIARQIGSGFSSPTSVSLNKANNLVFVADAANKNVTIIDYQTGENVTVLGPTDGLTDPRGAVDAPNAIY